MMFFRISPSPDWFDDIEPLASTKPASPVGRQVVDEVLHPGEVGVARRRHAVLPALVILQQFAAPVAVVEGRIGQHEVGLEVRVPVVVEGVAMGDLRVDAADGEVHLGQPPGGVVGLLAVDGDVADACRCAPR